MGRAGPFGLDNDTFDLEVAIEEKSLDSKYDLFFHFHNDISHTFVEDWAGNISRWCNDENYIDLTITVD